MARRPTGRRLQAPGLASGGPGRCHRPGAAGWPAGWPSPAARRLTAAAGHLRERWARSLQLRVVSTTLVISGAVVTVLGLFLMQYIASDVLQADAARAVNVVGDGVLTAEAKPWLSTNPGAATAQQLWDLARQLQARTGPGDYSIAILLAKPSQQYAANTAGGVSGIPDAARTLPCRARKASRSSRSRAPRTS